MKFGTVLTKMDTRTS